MIGLITILALEFLFLQGPEIDGRLPEGVAALLKACTLFVLSAIVLVEAGVLSGSRRFLDAAMYMVIVCLALRLPVANIREITDVADSLNNEPLELALLLWALLIMPLGVVAWPVIRIARERG